MSLVDKLIEDAILKTPVIISAFKKIRRVDFLPARLAPSADLDEPLPIGHGQTNSQPFTVAFMMEKLQPRPGDRILDVGCGSGWTSALLAEIVGKKGRVYGIEVVPELAKLAETNIKKYDFTATGRVKIFTGDGRCGLEGFAPFDKISVSAATEKIPEPLLAQLKIGGRMILPLGRQSKVQALVLIEKIEDGELKRTEFPGFMFVPLIKSQ
jgi:protein-L-isoaspartate(D-aspartate) O-methyltransferase